MQPKTLSDIIKELIEEIQEKISETTLYLGVESEDLDEYMSEVIQMYYITKDAHMQDCELHICSYCDIQYTLKRILQAYDEENFTLKACKDIQLMQIGLEDLEAGTNDAFFALAECNEAVN